MRKKLRITIIITLVFLFTLLCSCSNINNNDILEDNPIIETPITPENPPISPEKPPVEPEKPPIEPEKPPISPENPPIEPEKPPIEPEKPPIEPEKPPIEPEKPPIEPEEPPIEPEKPPIEPEEPPVEPETPQNILLGEYIYGYNSGGKTYNIQMSLHSDYATFYVDSVLVDKYFVKYSFTDVTIFNDKSSVMFVVGIDKTISYSGSRKALMQILKIKTAAFGNVLFDFTKVS